MSFFSYVYMNLHFLQSRADTSMNGVFKYIRQNRHPVNISHGQAFWQTHVHIHINILTGCFSGIGGQDTVYCPVSADLLYFTAAHIPAVLVQILQQTVVLSLTDIFLNQQYMVTHIMTDSGGFLFRFPHHLHLAVQQLFIYFQQFLFLLIVMFLAKMNVQMQNHILQYACHKQDQKCPYHIEDGKTLQIWPVCHDSAQHDRDKQCDSAKQIHFINQKIHTV